MQSQESRTDRQEVRAALVAVGCLLALTAAGLMRLAGPLTWLGYTLGVIFFASLYVPTLILASRRPRLDRCTAWLLRRLAGRSR
jgi:hypothetical protein